MACAQANQKDGKDKMIKQLGIAVLCGLILSGGAMAIDKKVDDSRPVIIELPASRVDVEKVTDTASSVPVKQGLVYKTMPLIDYDNEMLGGQARQIKVKFLVSAEGRVESGQIIESTGLHTMDGLIVRQLQRIRFYPYLENGIAIPVYTIQDFTFELSEMPETEGLVTPQTTEQYSAWYAAEKTFKSRIYQNWQVPANSRGMYAYVTVVLASDGKVQAIDFNQGTGRKAFNKSIQQAIQRSAPFDLPEGSIAPKVSRRLWLSFYEQ